MISRFRTLCCLTIVLAVAALADGQSGPRPGFSDWTKESGVAAIVEKHYQIEPKLWLSGMTLANLEGNGSLDLLLAGHGYVGAAGRNDGKGHFTWIDPKKNANTSRWKEAQLPVPGGEIRLIHDFNEDGKLDILAAYGDGLGVAYRNETKAGVWKFRSFDPGFPLFSRMVAMADLNRDGFVDYLVNVEGRGHPTAAVYFGKGNGKWEDGPAIDSLLESVGIPVDIHGNGFRPARQPARLLSHETQDSAKRRQDELHRRHQGSGP